MSHQIHSYSINAQLSMAAYADLDNIINNDDLITRLEQAGMSNSQARTFSGIDENGMLISDKGFRKKRTDLFLVE